MYSKTITIGNLTKDISLSYTPTGTAIGRTSIAYTEGFGDNKKSHFMDVTAWGKTAETMEKYLRKGSKVMLEGVVQFEQWTSQDGSNRSKHALRVETMKMLDSKSDNQSSNTQQQPQQPQYTNQYQVPVQEHKIPEIDIEDLEIPF